MAKRGAAIRKAQNGLQTDLGESISDADLQSLTSLYDKAKATKKGSDVIKFQQEFHRLLPKAALKYNKETKFLTRKAKNLNVKKSDFDKIDINNPTGDLEKRVLQGNEDEYFGPITTKYMEIAKASTKKKEVPKQNLVPLKQLNTYGEKKTETTTTESTRYPVTKYKDSQLLGIANQLLPYLRPSDIEELDPNQLVGELYALSQNQVEPVFAQKAIPRLDTPYDISLQDILNENRATLRRQQQLIGYNPAAQSSLAAGEYEANQKVLAEQFRLNQAKKDQVYSRNREILNQYDMTNLGILGQQADRQAQALSKTKATTQEALNSISSKIAQNKLDNRTLAVMENMYGYRYDPNFRLRNLQTAQWNIPTKYSGTAGANEVPVYDKDGTLLYYKTGTPTSSQLAPSNITTGTIPTNTYDQMNWQDQPSASMAKKGKKVSKTEQRNSSIVKALKNI
jgi:hypothetical protein